MGAWNQWNSMLYSRHIDAVERLFNACRERSFELERISDKSVFGDYDPAGQVDSSIRAFQTATGRLNELVTTMKAYQAEYDAMLESCHGNFENLTVENDIYGSFDGIAAGSAAAVSAVYAGSLAYQFHQSHSFSEFDDVAAFMETTSYSDFEIVNAVATIKDWETLTFDLLTHGGVAKDYCDKLLESALLSSLQAVPAYSYTAEKGDISALLSELTGLPDLEKEIRKIIDFINEHAEDGTTDEFIDELSVLLEKFLEFLGLEDMAAGLSNFLRDHSIRLEFYGIMAEAGIKMVDIAELYLDITLNAAANHLQQVAYLDSIGEALSMCGYSGGLEDTLDELRNKLASEETYIWKEVNGLLESYFDKQGATLISEFSGQILMSVCSGLPGVSDIAAGFNPISSADMVWSAVSTGLNVVVGDQIAAVQTLQGLHMYSAPLIKSYENYMAMMDAGVATAEDVKQADNLFQLIRASKMKEYECIQTIDIYGKWHDLAAEKYAELEKMGTLQNTNWWKDLGLSENPMVAGRKS